MTIEELKARLEDAYMAGETLASLRFEILALVEAANSECIQWDLEGNKTLAALDALNAKLEAL